eukprot:m.329124 g.329124  ORF g.329124 m.329124 type:complete len:80 (-) comp27704_c1_seq2:668-907(-)
MAGKESCRGYSGLLEYIPGVHPTEAPYTHGVDRWADVWSVGPQSQCATVITLFPEIKSNVTACNGSENEKFHNATVLVR